MPNTALPIYARHSEIMSAIRHNNVVIITAEAGAGKSTQVPQYLLEEGENLVVTQPRRLAARTVAARVAEELDVPLGDIVGYRTAHERQDSKATRCLFVTDGLALVRELMGAGSRVLVVDEVHEWNLNVEVLVAWTRHQTELGADFKVVLMSATLEADRLSAYFNGAPVIDVPGRTFPVEQRPPTGKKMEDDVVSLLRQGHNVLVFQPGKREISKTIRYLQGRADVNAEILPLHGRLTPDEQARCFRSYNRPKCVVSTNVAQTSVTIPDIDAVVDGGIERRIERVDGVEGLYLGAVSLADAEQRRGRAGRTKPGVYIDWCPSMERPDYPEAEILRVRFDQAVLRLAEAGIDMEELRFFHQPDIHEIHDARRALVVLGCMEEDGRVTQIGHRVAKMPISVKYGRMIVEADRLGVVDDVVTVAAILEQGGIVTRPCPAHKQARHKSCACWRRLAPNEKTSDAIAQLLVYQACAHMTREEMEEDGINPAAFYQASEKRRHLAEALRGKVGDHQSSGKREHILRAVCAGMADHLYRYDGSVLRSRDGQTRGLVRESVVAPTEWVVGEPFDLQVEAREGLVTQHKLRMATTVKLDWLAEVAPYLVTTKTGLHPRYDRRLDDIVSTTEVWFNGHMIDRREAVGVTHAEARHLLREGRNDRQWQRWTGRPKIALPNPAEDSATVPAIVVCDYGADAETEEPLLAYGVAILSRYRLPSEPWFKVVWTRDVEEAERKHQESVARLEVVRAEIKAAAARRRAVIEEKPLKRAAAQRLALALRRLEARKSEE